ncbi:MAG: 2-amino-4-hydroxy-6-hydroxymethyldihydropteridine diphosphokinase [Galbitalea sp.]
MRAILALGSNLGDRERTIRDAVAEIAALPQVSLGAVSALVETLALTPHGVDAAEPAYLNAVVSVETSLSPAELLARLNEIELRHGRLREVRWGNRTLDIDIVTMDGLRLESDTVSLPHPRAAERSFVLVPWLEIEPDAELPGIGRIDGLPAAREVVPRYLSEDIS